MSLTCLSCGLPVVPFGGEDVCVGTCEAGRDDREAAREEGGFASDDDVLEYESAPDLTAAWSETAKATR